MIDILLKSDRWNKYKDAHPGEAFDEWYRFITRLEERCAGGGRSQRQSLEVREHQLKLKDIEIESLKKKITRLEKQIQALQSAQNTKVEEKRQGSSECQKLELDAFMSEELDIENNRESRGSMPRSSNKEKSIGNQEKQASMDEIEEEAENMDAVFDDLFDDQLEQDRVDGTAENRTSARKRSMYGSDKKKTDLA